jgi:hypothetical protein
MAVYRLQCAWQIDTAFPRDALVITPHFNNTGGILTDSDTDALCEDLATALVAWDNKNTQLTVKAYDAQGTPPVAPVGMAVRNSGVIANSFTPREVALCLSFYSEQNVPRKRGRVFVPASVFAASLNVRADITARTKVGELATIFADLGGADIDWSVYSRVDDTARKVTNWWVDDEWDTIRSRGLRASERLSGTTTE